MNKKEQIMIVVLSIIVILLLFFDKKENIKYKYADYGYMVYLDSKEVGLIKNEKKLYSLIDKEQNEIKNKYNVSKVYPPESFKIVKLNTYNKNFTDEEKIYNEMAKMDDFTIKGYTYTIKFPKGKKLKPLEINVLDKKVFEDAIYNFVTAFISEEEFKDYINGNKKELTDIGKIIETMYFNETITLKENLISLKDKIFLDAEELSQYFLFGDNAKMSSYIVRPGDDIKKISEDHKLNPQEFLIANPKYRDTNTMLIEGSNVNVTILNPVLTFIYEVFQIEDSITRFSTKTVVDKTKDYGYREITTPGVNGITRNHENYQVINGEQSKEIKIGDNYEVIREKVDQVITVGRPSYHISGEYVDMKGNWGWPTNQPSVITSTYGYRCLRGRCKVHEGIDISGTGYGSPIYAIGDGVVTQVFPACTNCNKWSNGNYIVIDHGNNFYSAYLHLAGFTVKQGQKVSKGDQIGKMGSSGYTTGTHLHLGLYVEGEPFAGVHTRSINPFGSIY